MTPVITPGYLLRRFSSISCAYPGVLEKHHQPIQGMVFERLETIETFLWALQGKGARLHVRCVIAG